MTGRGFRSGCLPRTHCGGTLQAEVEALRAEVEALRAEVEALRAELGKTVCSVCGTRHDPETMTLVDNAWVCEECEYHNSVMASMEDMEDSPTRQ